MDEKILCELYRIQHLMGVKTTQPTKINEQIGIERLRKNTTPKVITDPKNPKFGQLDFSRPREGSEKKKAIYLGKDMGNGKEFIYYFGNDNFDKIKVVEDAKIFVINFTTSSKTLFPNVKVGDVERSDGTIAKNQEYIEGPNQVKKPDGTVEIKTVKYCLPTKEFWNLPILQGKVYKFIVPTRSSGSGLSTSKIQETMKTFSMILKLNTSPQTITDFQGNTKTITPTEISISCMGGDNGWGFKLTPPLFFNPENGEGYNQYSPEDYDDRSDWDVWYSHYGGWLEIGIGIASAFLGAGLGNILLKSIPAASSAYAFLSAGYAGSTTTYASLFMQVVTEGVMMSPIIKWQLDSGNTSDAMLNTLFCLIPFVSELPGVSRFIKGRYSKEAAKNLAEKMRNAGLEKIFYQAKNGSQTAVQDFNIFLKKLTGTEFAMFKEGMSMFAKEEGITTMKTSFKQLVESGGALAKEWGEAQTEAAKKSVMGNVGRVFGKKSSIAFDEGQKILNKWLNPLTAKTILPGQFFRMGVPIAAFSYAFKKGYKALTEEEKIQFDQNVRNYTGNTEYIKQLTEISPYFSQNLQAKVIEMIADDPQKAKDWASKKDFNSDPELKKISDQAGAEILKEKGQEYVNDLKALQPKLKELGFNMTYFESIIQKMKLIGFEWKSNISVANMELYEIEFTNSKYPDEVFIVKIENNDVEVKYYINDVLVNESDFTSETWTKPS